MIIYFGQKKMEKKGGAIKNIIKSKAFFRIGR